MRNIIKLDLILQMPYIVVGILLQIIIVCSTYSSFESVDSALVVFLVIPAISFIISIIGTCRATRKSNLKDDINILLCSLPIKKKDIVIGKVIVSLLVFQGLTVVSEVICIVIFKTNRVYINYNYIISMALLYLACELVFNLFNIYLNFTNRSKKERKGVNFIIVCIAILSINLINLIYVNKELIATKTLQLTIINILMIIVIPILIALYYKKSLNKLEE